MNKQNKINIQTQKQRLDQLNKQIADLRILASNENSAVRQDAYMKLKAVVQKRNEIQTIFNPIFG